ncbi:phenol 2-monooxygenase [Myxozyma melibiosi]|uniref:Phenol 2-monooxygenase n=1 Tax=Myxozyma melibiosi TaxID=54550 RepID=A0ABR1F4Z6_9ASCO
MKESNVDVLIIGAGPAGLMAANWFARTGTNYRIVDKRSSKIFAGQADGLQCRTLEVFQSFGFGDRALKEANHMLEISFWEPDGKGGLYRSARLPDSIPGISRFQQVVLHQGRIESWFLDAIRKWSGGKAKVERPVLPVRLEVDESKVEDPDAYPISVLLKTLDENEGTPEQFGAKIANGLFRSFEGDQEKYYKDAKNLANDDSLELVHAKYVMGCDGAHSWVRRQMGVEMEGESTDYVWGVLDSVPITDFPDIRNRCAIHSADSGSIMVIPREQGLVRLYIQLRETPRDPATKTESEMGKNEQKAIEKGRVDRSKITPEVILDNARKILSPYKLDITDIKWYTAYQIGQRVAPKFEKFERIFISGDACHTHSPKAGQGMNVSMMDTFNLAWKIAYVAKGLASREILKTYESERLGVAQALIAFDHKFSRLFSGKPALPGAIGNDGDGISLDEFHSFFAKGNEFASGTIVDYDDSVLIDKSAGKAVAQEIDKDVVLTISPLAKNISIGRRFDTAKVINQSDARPWYLTDCMLSDGRWRIVNFAGDFKQVPELSKKLNWLGEYLAGESSFIKKYTPPGAKVDSVIEVLTVHASKRVETEWDDFPLAFRPRDCAGRMDYWKIYVDDDSFHEGHGHAYEKYGIDREVGAYVVVRPDGYVSMVEPLGEEGIEKIAGFFGGFMIEQKVPPRTMFEEIETYGADSYGRPVLGM